MSIPSAIVKILCFSAVVLWCPYAKAQSDSIILKALQDEMKRSMTEIRYDGYQSPFFISYGMTDVSTFNAYATMGAIVQSATIPNRDKAVRVLAGDYSFNDESLDNNVFSEPSANDVPIPEEDDYLGIRRAFWATTDEVYKGAAQKYKKHQTTLREQNKLLGDMPHRTFAKTPVVTMRSAIEVSKPDKSTWENYCKKISAVFLSYPDILASDVVLTITTGKKYFVNTEGTLVISPLAFGVLQCRAQTSTSSGEPLFDNLTYYVPLPEQLPPLDMAIAETKEMADRLMSLRDAAPLAESYSGPVLFLGPSVADAFATTLFSFRESLVASNAILSSSDFRPESATALDARLGKTITDNTLTVTSRPKMTTFARRPLVGNYQVDDEGVVPPDRLVLIENGVLRNLLNDRSLTRTDQIANGHSNGPAVVDISFSKTMTSEGLKEQLIKMAKKEGLEFTIIVRSNASFGDGMTQFYKVDLDTGKEEVIRPAQLGGITLKNFKRIAGATKDQNAYTVQTGMGNFASFIVPSGLLLEDIDIAPLRLPDLEDEIFVESPLRN